MTRITAGNVSGKGQRETILTYEFVENPTLGQLVKVGFTIAGCIRIMGEVWCVSLAYSSYKRMPTLQTMISMPMPVLGRHTADVNKFVVLIQTIPILDLSHKLLLSAKIQKVCDT